MLVEIEDLTIFLFQGYESLVIGKTIPVWDCGN